MATTTNFGFETPDDTDLVKDGALAMRTLGNNIDARFGNVATYPSQIVNVVSGVSRPVPFATYAGAATLTFSASTSASVTVTFPASRFTQSPLVVVAGTGTSGSFSTITLRTSSVTTTSAQINGNLSASTTGSFAAWLIAIQMTSAASAG